MLGAMRPLIRATSAALSVCCAAALMLTLMLALPLAAAPAQDSGPRASAATRPGFVWPLAHRPAVARGFEPPPFKYGRGHRGVDLAGVPGQPVLAAGSGTIAFAGQVAGRGVVSIDHPGGLRTTYEPVAGTLRAGDLVDAGVPIGSLDAGHLGCGHPACLHWGLRRGEDYLNPLTLIGAVVIRLKPADVPGHGPPVIEPR